MLAPCIIFSLCSPGWPGTRYDPPGSQTQIELHHLPPSNFSGSLSPMRRGVERQALVAGSASPKPLSKLHSPH